MRNSHLFKLQKRFAYLSVIYSIAGLLFSFLLNAQSNPEKGLPFITNYTPKTFKALPQTWCIIEDRRGIMYFGVQAAILEYDGVKWRKVIFSGTAPPVIRSLARDKNGIIYYGASADFGYLVQDSLGQTRAVSLRQYIPEAYRNFFDVWTIHVNGSDIYFQSREYIFRMNEKKEIKTWTPKTKFMYAFFYDDNYFVHESNVGLLKLVQDSLLLIPGSEFLGQERMQVMLPYSGPSSQPNPGAGKQYILGMFYAGMFLFDGNTFRPFKTEADELVRSGTLYKGTSLPNGNYVLSTTGKGLVIIDAFGKILQLINRDVGLQDESVYGVYSDSKGTLWLALDNGISRVETASPLTQFTNQSGINTATLAINRFEGKLYLGTTNGLLKFNNQTSRFDPVNLVPPNQTFSLLKEGNTLLVPNDGLFSIRNDKTSLIRSSKGGDLQLSGLFVSKKHPDMLLGGATFGVAVFYKKNPDQPWQFKGHIPNLDDQFWTFSENKNGTIWAGTQSGAVYLLTPAFDKNGQPDIHQFRFERFGETNGLKNSLGAVYSIKGESWFVGDSALYKFDETKKRFYPDTTTFGHFVNGGGSSEFDMIEDASGRVWLRFGKEAILATPQPNGKYRIDKTPLLPIAERTFGKIYPEANGIVWICTTDGLVRYDENLQKNYDQPFKTVLRHIAAGKNLLNPAPNGSKENASVSYKNNTLRFEYAAPFFEQEDKTLYQTWLEGFETDWSGYDNNYYKEYTNLPAGKYHFHVRAKNVYQKLSEETVYSFTIKPPWYASWWAYTLYALAVAALIYLIVRYRTDKLHEKHRELEKTVAQRTGELSHRVEELAVINSVQEGLVKEMGIQDIYDLVGEKIRAIFNAQVIDIVTYDSKTNLLEDRYAYEKGDRSLLGPREPQGFRKYVIETRQVQVINEGIQKRMLEFDNKVLMGEESKSVVFVPLITSGEVKGIISLQDLDKEHAFSDQDVSLLTTLANSMSVALESARRFDETNRLLTETEQRNAELAVINSVQESLVAKMDIQGIYELVGEKIREIFDAQVIDIVTYDSETNLIEDRYAYEKGDRTMLGKRPPNGFRKHVIQTRQLLLHNENVEQATRDFDNEILIGEMPKSQMYVPMIAGGIVKGVISLQNLDHEQAFSNSDTSLLTTLANSMSVALESARLFDETNRLLKETEQRTAELAVINSVQEGLAKELDIQSIYELVGNTIRDVFNANAQAVIIASLDQETKTEHFNYVIEKGERFYLDSRPYDKLRQHLVETREKILINKNDDEAAAKFDLKTLPGTEFPKSLLFVPLFSGDKVKSYVSLQNIDKENAFSDADVRLLETLANSMSVALENARLFDETTRLLKETEQRNAELAVINSVQDGLVREMDIQGIYDLVGEKMREIFDAQVIDIVTYDRKANLIEDRYSFEKGDRTLLGPREPKGFRKNVIDSLQPVFISENLKKHFDLDNNPILVGDIPKSIVFVPMIVGGEVKGVISLQNIDHENAFTHSDLSLLTTLANSMSVALESARLFDETTRLLKETEQRNAELAVINSVQESLVAQMDMQGIYELVGEKMREIFNAQVIDIVTYDKANNFIEDRYAYEKGDRTLVGPRAPKGFRKHVIQTAQLLVINKDVEKLRSIYDNTVVVGQAAKSLVLVPLIAGGEVTGVISLQNLDQEDAFSNSDVSLLATLVNSMSVALKSASLFDETAHLLKETEQRTAELAVINSVQEGLAKELDMTGIYNLVGDRLSELFPDSQTLVIRTFDHDTGLEHWQYAKEKGLRQFVDPRPFNWNSQQLILTKQPLDIKENYVETSKKHGGSGVTVGLPPKSAVFVPMLAGELVKGSISLQNVDKENAFTDADLRLLTTITNSMSVALENARLFDETNRLLKETELRKAELATINSVQEGLVKEFKSQAIYELVGERLCDLFDTQTVLIRTFDHETGMEIWRYAIEKGERQYSEPRPLIWANKQMIKTHQPILINENYLETSKKFGGSGVSMGKPPKSAVFVPMVVGDTVRGSVSLQNVDKEHAFKESDLRLLTTLTNSMGVALENARLFDETTRLLGEAKQRAAELSTVNNISQALTSQLNPEELIKLVGDQMKDLFHANIVYLALLNPKTKIIHFPYMQGDTLTPMKLGKGLTSKIILSGKSLLINKQVTAKTEELGIAHIGVPAASYLGVPIPVGEEIIGVLSVQSTESENRFNENDERLLSTIPASVGVALRKAQLFEELTLAKQQAEEASQTADKANQAKSSFLSTVSHELRTPLTSVLGFAKIIKKRLEEKIFPATNQSDPKTGKTIQQISENLKVVISEGERLTNLINEVLDLAKIEAGKMEWNLESISMQEIIERAIAATTSLFEQKNLVLEKYIDPDLPLIDGDRDKLIQVVVNLISNAVKFTPSGKVTCWANQQKDEIVVGIEDTGIGIAPQDHKAVFEQFKQVVGDTLTDKPKGTGLGLPICKEIVEHHGGRIWLKSEAGKGSTFFFALPVQKPDAAKPIHLNDLVKQLKEQMAQSKFNLNGNHATILVVDDDDSIRSLLNQELGDVGYTIEEAANGKEALASIRNHRPDLVILDVMMPEMNGFDVAAILKNDPQTMDIPIIVLSIVQDKARGFRIGVDRYLTKPIDTAQLFSEVGSLLEQGKSRKKVMVVDEDTTAVRTLTDVLQAKGYQVVESDGKELVEKAILTQPDIIILNSVLSDKQEIVQSLRFEKGLENVLFLIYQ